MQINMAAIRLLSGEMDHTMDIERVQHLLGFRSMRVNGRENEEVSSVMRVATNQRYVCALRVYVCARARVSYGQVLWVPLWYAIRKLSMVCLHFTELRVEILKEHITLATHCCHSSIACPLS